MLVCSLTVVLVSDSVLVVVTAFSLSACLFAIMACHSGSSLTSLFREAQKEVSDCPEVDALAGGGTGQGFDSLSRFIPGVVSILFLGDTGVVALLVSTRVVFETATASSLPGLGP